MTLGSNGQISSGDYAIVNQQFIDALRDQSVDRLCSILPDHKNGHIKLNMHEIRNDQLEPIWRLCTQYRRAFRFIPSGIPNHVALEIYRPGETITK